MGPPSCYHPTMQPHIHHTCCPRRMPRRQPLLTLTAAHTAHPRGTTHCGTRRQREMFRHHTSRLDIQQLHTTCQTRSSNMGRPMPPWCTATAKTHTPWHVVDTQPTRSTRPRSPPSPRQHQRSPTTCWARGGQGWLWGGCPCIVWGSACMVVCIVVHGSAWCGNAYTAPSSCGGGVCCFGWFCGPAGQWHPKTL